MAKVTPWLWFAHEALEAAEFYVSILPDSRIDRVVDYPTDTPGGPAGSVAVVEFTLGRPAYGGPERRHASGVRPRHLARL